MKLFERLRLMSEIRELCHRIFTLYGEQKQNSHYTHELDQRSRIIVYVGDIPSIVFAVDDDRLTIYMVHELSFFQEWFWSQELIKHGLLSQDLIDLLKIIRSNVERNIIKQLESAVEQHHPQLLASFKHEMELLQDQRERYGSVEHDPAKVISLITTYRELYKLYEASKERSFVVKRTWLYDVLFSFYKPGLIESFDRLINVEIVPLGQLSIICKAEIAQIRLNEMIFMTICKNAIKERSVR